jgi:ketosteroid isomerase-like protein
MKKRSLLLTLTLCAVVGTIPGLPAVAQSVNNAQIAALYQQFGSAVRHKDVDGIMSVYVRGNTLFVFDVGTPREHVGVAELLQRLEDVLCFGQRRHNARYQRAERHGERGCRLYA